MGLGVSKSKYIGSIEINVFHILHFSIWFGSVSQGMYKNKVNFDNSFEILTLLFSELENLVQESLESWKILFQRTIEVIQFSQSQFLLAHWLQNDFESSNLARNPIKKISQNKKAKKKNWEKLCLNWKTSIFLFQL